MTEIIHLRGPILAGPDDVRDQAWVVDGTITYARPGGSREIRSIDGWVLPGLVDAHCHVGLSLQGAVDKETAEAQATTDRDGGALLIRDAGSAADTRWIDERDDLPKIIRAGRHIARTRRYVRGYAHEIEPDQLVSRVRAEARAGDGWVKLVGDWIDREAGDLTPCWPRDVLTEAIAVAHEEGARVTAHCFGQESLHDFVAAGTDGIEHATGLEPETISQFADQGIAIVPTLVNIATFPALAAPAQEKFPAYHARMLDLHARRYETFGAAHDAGIPMFVGTDAGGSLSHGIVVSEILELAKVMPAIESLGAATWSARAWLGRPCLEEGDPADLVVVKGDPRSDLQLLADLEAIVLRGRVVG